MQDNRAAIETIVGDDDFVFVNIAPEDDQTFEPLIDLIMRMLHKRKQIQV